MCWQMRTHVVSVVENVLCWCLWKWVKDWMLMIFYVWNDFFPKFLCCELRRKGGLVSLFDLENYGQSALLGSMSATRDNVAVVEWNASQQADYKNLIVAAVFLFCLILVI